MTEKERSAYTFYMKKVYNDRDELEAAIMKGEAKGLAKGKAEGRAEGLAEGKAEGELQAKRAIAIEMLKDNESDDKILKYSKLTHEDLVYLKKQINV